MLAAIWLINDLQKLDRGVNFWRYHTSTYIGFFCKCLSQRNINDEINISVYGKRAVPNAARFGIGAGSLSEIQDAIGKRTALVDGAIDRNA